MFAAILGSSGLTQAGGSPAHHHHNEVSGADLEEEDADHDYEEEVGGADLEEEDADHDYEEEVGVGDLTIQSWFPPDQARCRPRAAPF